MEQEDFSSVKELVQGTPLNGGKYFIERKIGEGGFGITYMAVQAGLNRKVCIKEFFLAGKCIRNTRTKTVIPQDLSSDVFEKYRNAFVNEARTLAQLSHPNIVEVIEVFDENDTSYMVMPFIEGKSLQNIVEKNGKIEVSDAVNFVAQVTGAVQYIHSKNILHRDIKPDNIMITADYKAILIDFGSAREFVNDKTQSHTSMLTHGYAPTEQYTRNSRKGYYTDIYAIGATLYFCLTGTVPVEAAARLTEKMPEPKELNPAVPDEINRTILKAMQLKSENRHQTVQEFMDDLLDIKPSVLIDESIGQDVDLRKKTKRWTIISLMIVVVFTALTVIFLQDRGVGGKNVRYKTKNFLAGGLYPMVKVKGGRFTMGNEKFGEDCTPHQVSVSDFYIGQFEVSQGLFRKVMGYNPSDFSPKSDPNGKVLTQEERDMFPVENVSFKEVQEFIYRLNTKTGVQFSLPTEAQWEFAARGGKKDEGHIYSTGMYANLVWYDKNNPIVVNYKNSVNMIGLYNMSGNVAEWCQDYYSEDFYQKTAGYINPVNREKGDYRVVRGGSFLDTDSEYVSVFFRDAQDEERKTNVGFRLVVNID